MIRHIPPEETKRWTGPYQGNYYGTLWKTFNVDLDMSEGKILLSQRFQRIEDSSEMIGESAGVWSGIRTFVRTDADCTDRYWALSTVELMKTDSSTAGGEQQAEPDRDWDPDAIASTPTVNLRDMTIHGNDSRADSGRNKLFVTTDTDIWVLNDSGNNAWTANWWVTKQAQPGLKSITAIGGGVYKPIEYFRFRKISLVGDGNLIHTISRPSDTQNDTITYARLVLPSNYLINHIFTTSSRAWILCSDRFGADGAIVEWDGFSQTYNEIYSTYGRGAATGVNYRESPLIVNVKGLILEYTGKGFQPMVRNGQQIALPIAEEPETDLDDTSDTTLPSIGRIRPRGTAIGADGLVYMNVQWPNVRSWRQDAGIYCLNPQTGRLYNKYSLGQWGDSVDYGSPQGAWRAGALYPTTSSTAKRNLLAGGFIFTTASSTSFQTGIWLLEAATSTTVSRGYFITQYIPSGEVREYWDITWVKFKRFATSGNSIIVKAKGTRSLTASGGFPLDKTITWTSSTTFTVTLASADDPIQVGDEVEVIIGGNAGFLMHITVISGAHAALQTITVDETVTTTSGSATGRFDRWKKLGTITGNTTVSEQFVNIGIDSSFIQFKVEMRGPVREMEISDLIVKSKSSIII